MRALSIICTLFYFSLVLAMQAQEEANNSSDEDTFIEYSYSDSQDSQEDEGDALGENILSSGAAQKSSDEQTIIERSYSDLQDSQEDEHGDLWEKILSSVDKLLISISSVFFVDLR